MYVCMYVCSLSTNVRTRSLFFSSLALSLSLSGFRA